MCEALFSLVFRQFSKESIFAFSAVAVVAFGVDERVMSTRANRASIFGVHVEVAPVGSEEEIYGLCFQKAEGACVVGGDDKVVFVAEEDVTGVHVRTADT